jgi:hypothetical protein
MIPAHGWATRRSPAERLRYLTSRASMKPTGSRSTFSKWSIPLRDRNARKISQDAITSPDTPHYAWWWPDAAADGDGAWVAS